MSVVRYLTVNEMDGESDRLAIEVRQCDASLSYNTKEVRIAMTRRDQLIISQGKFHISIEIDPEELLRFVAEAKEFIDEEKVVAKLSGKEL